MKILEVNNAEDAGNEVFSSLKKQLYTPQEQVKLSAADPFKHPYFYKAYVLLADAKPVAHAVIYNNPFLMFEGQKAMCLGNYECEDNPEFSKAILQHLLHVAKQIGVTYLIGPMNGSTWDAYRFNDQPKKGSFFLEPYNKDYYNEQFIQTKFHNIGSYFSAIDEEMNYENAALLKRENDLTELGVVFRNIDTGKYEDELKKVYELCLESFADNFLYTPISWEDFRLKYFSALPYIEKDFILLAEDSDAQLVGFIFCLPNLFNKEKKQLIIKTVARKKGRNYRGLGDILSQKITLHAKTLGYTGIIHALMFSDNHSLNISKKHSAKIFKTYSLYAAKV
ncbi:MAG: hypothetical protein ACXWDO_00185 [Bacteroidia bacterium]